MKYSLHGYGEMIADSVRMDAYLRALQKAIQPGDTVLDLGAGPCIIGLWACLYGAGRVVAVEDDSSLEVGESIVAKSAFHNRFQFINELSTSIDPPTRCNVMVSDLRGVVPLYGYHIPSIVDARQRWLFEGARQIPEKDTIYAAIVSNQSLFDEHFSAWAEDMNDWSFAPARTLMSNVTRKVNLQEDDLLVDPAVWHSLDYRSITKADHQAAVEWKLDRDGKGHGLVMWFESTLYNDVTLSSRPGSPKVIYGQMFFPWPRPVALRKGDSVVAQVRADLIKDDYVWSWQTKIHPADRSETVSFQQSTFQGQGLSLKDVSRMQVKSTPRLEPKGQATALALAAMNGETSLSDVASKLTNEMPEQFPSVTDAVNFVSDLHGLYWR